MSDEVFIALIGSAGTVFVGLLTFIGVVISNKNANKKINDDVHHHLQTAQAVTDTKIEELTREVREHNGFAHKIPAIEAKIEDLRRDVEQIRKGA